jgi:predicted nucleic acid-binding protein
MEPRPLAELPSRTSVLLDANVLIYSLSRSSLQCAELLRRCDIEEISGFSTAEALNEVCHRLMLAEAYSKRLIARPAADAIRGHRALISGLRDYWRQMERLLASNILILELDEWRIGRAQAVREQHGLMTNDSAILAAALELGISNLATNDADFEGIPGIVVYRPTDV